MSESNQIIPLEKQIAPPEPTIGAMLAGFIESGIVAENVAAFGQLVELKERVDARNAEKEFASASVDLQRDTPAIAATKPVPNKDGSIRYRFAPFEEIMRKVSPLLSRHGFSVSFTTKFNEGRITVFCTLQHKGGHSRTNEFAVRIGGGPPGATETQADGAAKTYAKRGALCDALNIVVDHEIDADDARAVGGPISKDEADDLCRRARAVGANEAALLKFAGAADYDTIGAARLPALLEMLARKERAKSAQGDA